MSPRQLRSSRLISSTPNAVSSSDQTFGSKQPAGKSQGLIEEERWLKHLCEKGNPGVGDPLRPVSEETFQSDWAKMRGEPEPQTPCSNSNTNDKDSDDTPPRSVPPKRKARATPEQATRASKRLRNRAAVTPSDSASSASPPTITITDDDEDDDEKDSNSDSDDSHTSDDSDDQSPAVSTPTAPDLRLKTDPVIGRNGFRLLHPQHHFIVGPDQSRHLTMTYTDNKHAGPQTYVYGPRGANAAAPIDWSSKAHVARLNRWFNQVLKRHGARALRQDVVWFTAEERAWLRALGARMERDGRVLPKRRQAELFNARWAGSVIAAGRHAGTTRPVRSVDSLQSEVFRNKLYPESLKRRKARSAA
ncbi:hypothetical protein GTA08_BOTSDO04239 [Neofusicoccum parvum]|uniref:Uncharacterized protein n=1 Tax=Neofusicoccum parvum TaxID=310453 RepID=A0ACB5SLP7_9PEZI|nr:hypothetical protein GTA08_BOTSDO04239 [Neofusicoccum parvum]